jgi:hypothetical protein
VLPKLSMHVGPLLYSLDMALSNHRLRLVRGLYSSWGHKWSVAYGLSSVVLAHAAFGGVSSAIHLIAYRGVHASCFMPQGALAQMLGHIINPASDTQGQNIEPPMALQPLVPWSPIVQDGLLHGEGLFDVFCRSVFAPTKWVHRGVSPEELLCIFDVPSVLAQHFLANHRDCSLLLRSLPSIVVAAVFWSMWGRVEGGLSAICLNTRQGDEHRGQVDGDLHMEPMELEEDGMEEEEEEVDTAGREELNGTSGDRSSSEELEAQLRVAAQDWSPITRYNFGFDSGIIASKEIKSLPPAAHEAVLDKVKFEHDLAEAVKADDAEVPIHLWDEKVCRGFPSVRESAALTTLHTFCLRIY